MRYTFKIRSRRPETSQEIESKGKTKLTSFFFSIFLFALGLQLRNSVSHTLAQGLVIIGGGGGSVIFNIKRGIINI